MKRAVLLLAAACAPAAPPPPGTDPHDAERATVDGGDGEDGPPRPDAAPLPPQTSRLRIVNRCDQPIWIAHAGGWPDLRPATRIDRLARRGTAGSAYTESPPEAPAAGLPDQNARLDPGAYHDYPIPDGGLASARFWPKLGCDDDGHGCRIGDTGEGGGIPCGPAGCHPPLDSKFEVTYAPIGSATATFYNLSLVDGYTLPFAVSPVGEGAGVGSCTVSDCGGMTLDACPTAEDLGLGHDDVDLRLIDGAGPIGCLSPCKAWHYPAPYGLGRPETEEPGWHLCCPEGFSPEACRDPSDPLSVVHTDFVALVHARCPTAYGYSYDDAAGLHACPAATGFEVVFCP